MKKSFLCLIFSLMSSTIQPSLKSPNDKTYEEARNKSWELLLNIRECCENFGYNHPSTQEAIAKYQDQHKKYFGLFDRQQAYLTRERDRRIVGDYLKRSTETMELPTIKISPPTPPNSPTSSLLPPFAGIKWLLEKCCRKKAA